MSAELRGEKGQATVEFALALILTLAFVFFYIHLSLVFAWGNYVHYATFMSARAQLAASHTAEDQLERARTVLAQMVKKGPALPRIDRLPMVAKGEGGMEMPGAEFRQLPDTAAERSTAWMEGVRYTFKSRIFLLPFGGAGPGRPGNVLKLTSESWLGREPSYSECLNAMDGKIIDNGC